MKRFKISKFIFSVLFPVSVLFPSALFAQLDDVQPVPPPRVPAAEFTEERTTYFDVNYMRVDADGFVIQGLDLGFNVVGMLGSLGYNLGVGWTILRGSDTMMDMTSFSISTNANLAARITGTAETNSMIIFGGPHLGYTRAFIDMGGMDAELFLGVYGVLVGMKGRIQIGENLWFVPWYAWKHDRYSASVTIDGNTESFDIDPSNAHLIGFDIEIGSFSIGMILNMLNNSNNDTLTLGATFKFD